MSPCVQHALPGRAIAQAVSRWLPTAAARVRARVWSCGICGGQSGAGAGFLRVLRFPLPIFIPPISPQSQSSIIWGWYNRPVVAAVPSGLSLTPLTIIKRTCPAHFILLHLITLIWPIKGEMEHSHKHLTTASFDYQTQYLRQKLHSTK
jgi:hypothetical protein